MDLNFALGTAGVILTVLFGVWGIALAVRTKYPGKLSLYSEQAIPLFESIVKSVPDLAVAFRGDPVDPGIVLLKYILVNEGSVDISPPMVAEPVHVLPPSGVIWLGATITGASPKVEAHAEVTANGLELRFGLFRRDEFIRFDLIAQAKDDSAAGEVFGRAVANRIKESTRIVHRIANTQATKLRDMPADTSGKSHGHGSTKILLGMGLVLAALLMLGYWLDRLPVVIQYKLGEHNGAAVWANVEARPRDFVEIEPLNGDPKRRIPVKDFVTLVRDARTAPEQLILTLMTAMAVLYILFPSGALAYSVYHRRRFRRILAGTRLQNEPAA